MSEMIERVARAICRQPGSLCVGFCHDLHCKDAVAMHGADARAAIEAMRELNDEMAEIISIEGRCCGGIAESIWSRCIDAALDDQHDRAERA